MNSAILRVSLLALVCIAVTGLLLAVFNTLLTWIAPCYLNATCQQTPITGAIGYLCDVLGHISYFAIFPLAALLFRREFRKLFTSRRAGKISRIVFGLIPVFLYPAKYALNVTLF